MLTAELLYRTARAEWYLKHGGLMETIWLQLRGEWCVRPSLSPATAGWARRTSAGAGPRNPVDDAWPATARVDKNTLLLSDQLQRPFTYSPGLSFWHLHTRPRDVAGSYGASWRRHQSPPHSLGPPSQSTRELGAGVGCGDRACLQLKACFTSHVSE